MTLWLPLLVKVWFLLMLCVFLHQRSDAKPRLLHADRGAAAAVGARCSDRNRRHHPSRRGGSGQRGAVALHAEWEAGLPERTSTRTQQGGAAESDPNTGLREVWFTVSYSCTEDLINL